jgi:hypothetical protein
MRRLVISFGLAVLFAALLLPALPAAGAPRGDATDGPAWTWFGDLLARLRPLWGATGPEADTDGGAALAAGADTGPELGPNGLAAPASKDNGPELDPDG